MADPVTSAATCFALLIAQSGQSYMVHGYPTIEAAKQAKADLSGGYDAVNRIDRERYLASPQYAIDQARDKREADERAAKRKAMGCPVEYTYSGPIRCQLNMAIGTLMTSGRLTVDTDVRVFPEPCRKEDLDAK